jgi:adenine-specific DNA-methyltransferase
MLFNDMATKKLILPKTRYQGSKAKLVKTMHKECKQNLPVFQIVLDVFGGTGIFSLYLQNQGIGVVYNDIMHFNSRVADALLNAKLHDVPSEEELQSLFAEMDHTYPTFIQDNFKDIFFLDGENGQLDVVIENIRRLSAIEPNKGNVCMYLLIQSCIIKRPYNLFHRKNLEMRTKEVERKFGNKTSWDTTFLNHMIKFRKELVETIRSSQRDDRHEQQLCANIFTYPFDQIPDDVVNVVDTVYLDPPYFRKKKPNKDYIEYYHFLEGMSKYDEWKNVIDYTSPNRKFNTEHSEIYTINDPYEMFAKIIQKFSKRNLVISYNEGGVPTVEEIETMLRNSKRNVVVIQTNYQYALSKKKQKECIFIAWD